MAVRSPRLLAPCRLGLALWIVALLPAQDRFGWTELSPSLAPSPRAAFGFAADSVGGGFLLFGGSTGPGYEVADTWRWDGLAWQRAATAGPSAREYPGMAADPARGLVVLFGGADRPTTMPGALTLFGDTWEWDGNRWAQRTPSSAPAARNQHALAFHGPTARILLFGGASGHYTATLGDTWEWNGANWQARNPALAPPARSAHAMCEDPRRGVVVLFGGSADVTGPFLGDTWEWDGISWTQRSPQHAPSPRRGHMMAFDSRRGRVVLFGGHDGALLADTWEWDGIDWVPRPSDTSPPARNHGGLGYDAARERVDLFGGGGTAVRLADNWYQRELITASIALFGQGCAGAVGVPVLTPNGAPRLGWPGFSLQVGSVPQRSTVFLGVSFARRDTTIGPCTVYPQLPFEGVLMAFTHVGQESFRIAIPSDTALRGVRFYAQGGALDPAGALLGLVSLSQAAEARIGD